MTATETNEGTLTAIALVTMLRERGYLIARSREFFYAVVPRIEPGDPILSWLSEHGAKLRQWQPEQVTNPDRIAYEANLLWAEVSDEDGPRAIWEAAAP